MPGRRAASLAVCASGDRSNPFADASAQQVAVNRLEVRFDLVSAVQTGQRLGPTLTPGADKTSAHVMLRYRFSVKFTGRHSYGMPGPFLNIEN